MSAFEGVAAVLALLALTVRLAGRQHRLLHLLQLEHYEGPRLMLWLRRRGELIALPEALTLTLLFAGAVAASSAGSGWLCGVLLLLAIPLGALGVGDWRREAVKPLVLTGRAKRLLATALAPPTLLVIAAITLAAVGLSTISLAALLAIGLLLLVGAPWTLLGANQLLKPLQSQINRRYLQRARRSLRDWDPLVVGITGSYGKTTTKFCVGAVLAADRPTLVTPESYNSFLGVLRTINEHLRQAHRAFVVEMGMFRRGDIAELCELVHPTIGVITAIGPMHLERLGSIEQIAAAKGELLDALPAEGHFVTNGEDPRCLELAARATVPVTLFGIHDPKAGPSEDGIHDPKAGLSEDGIHDPKAGPSEDATASPAGEPTQSTPQKSPKSTAAVQVIARDVRLAEGRTTFQLQLDGPDSPQIPVSAALLGRHNVLNLLAAAAVGHVLGIEPARIAEGLSRVESPAHRLQPIHNRRAGVVVIDDAYNSNPDGAASALEVLREHPATRRLLVTPGMVELGELETELNRRFGEQAGAVCDLVILVGSARTVPIREGLAGVGMDPANVHVVRDIAEATALLARLTRAGDVVLFENDLPDTYAETDGAARAAA
ncbi:MAG TPA: UDP-N-acetylmuramoyl-tripeptide--D-alanyl-D-alanine ligase [Solirubrobacteraceae bacterium]|nr:UDP-N-acetylmuramoyl-tripeptide--D-alanyl-D-alanine ligase [Solirubrobacteraceae bacterium]